MSWVIKTEKTRNKLYRNAKKKSIGEKTLESCFLGIQIDQIPWGTKQQDWFVWINIDLTGNWTNLCG